MERFGDVRYEVDAGGVALLTLDDPERMNALGTGIREGILSGLAAADEDDAVGAVVITGTGKCFCAGGDLAEMARIADGGFNADTVRRFVLASVETLVAPERCRKPVVAAVNGMAFGGGFELAIACDFVIASERAKFCVPEINLGVLPALGLVRLSEMVGRMKAKELSMLGDPFSAQDAERLGLVLRTTPADVILSEAIAFAARLASKPRLAIGMAKSFYNRGLGGDEMRHALDGFPYLFMHADAQEGIAAFRDKREPNFARS